jgi:beta-glucanase (GH16 family)
MSTLTNAQATATSLTAAQATLKQIGNHPTLKGQLTSAQTSNNAVIAALVPTVVQPVGIPGTWTPIFAEEFTESALDTSKWTIDEGWVKNDVVVHASNFSISNGCGVLQLANADSGVELVTNDTILAVGDCVEYRINAATFTNWLAGWTAAQQWPQGGELDVLEAGAGGATYNYHHGTGNGTQAGPFAYSSGLAGAFHTFAVLRGATEATFYLDGKPFGQPVPTSDTGAAHYLILTMGLATGAVGVYGLAGAMQVDYVRAWSLASH